MGVVVAVPWPGSPQERLPRLASQIGRDMAVQRLAAVVGMHGEYVERELAFNVPQRLQRRMLAPVPRRAEDCPLRLSVRAVEDPEEVVRRVAAAEGEGVDLRVARWDVAGHDGLPGRAGRVVLDLVAHAAPGTLVRLCPSGLHPGLPGQQARHRAVTHGEQLRPDVRLDVRDLRRVFLRPAFRLRLEVRQARASGLAPDLLQHCGDIVAVGLPPALALTELPVPGQQAVRVLALVARRLAHLVEDAAALGAVRLGIRPALRAYVLVRCHS